MYCGYGIGFDRKSSFPFPSGRFGSNVIIFGVDMSSKKNFYLNLHYNGANTYLFVNGV